MIRNLVVIFGFWTAFVAAEAAENPTLSLAEAIGTALSNHPELKQARAQVEEARLREQAVLTQYLPRVDTQFARNHRDSNTYVEEFDEFAAQEGWNNQLSLSVVQNLDMQGKVYRQFRRAQLVRQGLEEQLTFEESALALQVVDVYYTLLDFKRSLVGLETKLERNKANQQLIDTEVQLGRRSQTDLGEVKYTAAKVAIEILKAKQAIESSQKQLGILLYTDSRNLPRVQVESAENEPNFIGDWQVQAAALRPAAALASRGDVTSLRKQIASSESERTEDHWKFVPDLDLRADYKRDFSRYANHADPDAPDTALTIGLVASWNLFAGGKDYLQIRENALARYRDELSYAHTIQKGIVELDDSKDQLITQHQLVEASKTLLATASEKYESIKAQYELGRKPTSELLEAQVDLTDAEIGHDQERYRFYRQYAKLLHLSGSLAAKFKETLQ